MAKDKFFNVSVDTIYTQLEVLNLVKNKNDFRRVLEERDYELGRDVKPNGTVVVLMDYNDAVDLRKYLSKQQKVERSKKRRGPHSCGSLEAKLD